MVLYSRSWSRQSRAGSGTLLERIAEHRSPELLFAWIRTLVSLSILAACLYIILSQQFPSDTTKWAYGMVGVVTGYWLR